MPRQRLDARLALADALQRRLMTTPLARITVRSLCQDAGLSRQAFYYHFANVSELVIWTFKHEVADQILSHASYREWSDGFLSMLLWMHRHPEQTYAVVESLTVHEVQLFLHSQLRAMMEAIVDELVDDLTPAPHDRVFVIDHFTLSVLGHVSQWLATSMRDDPYLLVERVERILHGQTRRALEDFSRSPSPAPACE